MLFLSATVEAKRHDKKLAAESAYRLPPGSKLVQDTGFQGFSLAIGTTLQPKKKPGGQALTDMEKHRNHWVASLRMRMEHTIGSIKRYRIVKDKIRAWKGTFRDAVMETCCGLHNFRLRFRPRRYPPIQGHLFAHL